MKKHPSLYGMDRIKAVPELQVRSVDEDQVRSLMDAMSMAPDNPDFKQPPPIDIYKVTDRDWGETLILVDGWHRFTARKNLKQANIYAYLFVGTYQDALDHAIEANTRHGLPLSRADRRRAVEKLLKATPERSNKWLSEIAGVNDKMVKDVRVELEERGLIETPDKCIGKDGKEYATQIEREKGHSRLMTKIHWASQNQMNIFLKAVEHMAKSGGSEKLNQCAEWISADYLAGVGEAVPEPAPIETVTKPVTKSLF